MWLNLSYPICTQNGLVGESYLTDVDTFVEGVNLTHFVQTSMIISVVIIRSFVVIV